MRKWIFLPILLAWLCSCASAPGPPTAAKVPTRTYVINKDKKQIWDAALAVLAERGFSIHHKNFNSGTILTDWNPINDPAVAGTLDAWFDARVETKFDIEIRPADAGSCSVTTVITKFMRSRRPAYNQKSEACAEMYDLWYARLGEKLGLSKPAVAPQAP